MILDTGFYFVSFLFGFVGAWIVTKHGHKLGILDQPNERSSHSTIVPKGGGIGIWVTFLFSCLYTKMSVWFWLPITILSFLALWNDRSEISPKRRLMAQFFLIAILLFCMDSSLDRAEYLGLTLFGIIYIVGTANFYNFMDGINGIAGITGIVGFGLLTFYLINLQGSSPFAILSVAIALSCLGFLPLNWPQARVFMGDIGSILLGSVFGTLVYLSANSLLDFLCMSAFLFPFYADELTTMFFRMRDKEILTKAHRRHIYQLLVNEKGYPHWKVSLGFGVLQLFIGINVILVKSYGLVWVTGLLAFHFLAFIAGTSYLRISLENCE
jgi:Fuc2NAc and GlcNAc transferase